MAERTTTTAEIVDVLNFDAGTTMFGFRVWADRRQGRSGLTKGRKVGMIVHATLPGLLRDVADLVEQSGGTLEDLIQKHFQER